MGTQGSPLSADFKKAIVAVKGYFDRCKQSPGEEEGTTIAQRTADALDIGIATVRRVMADYNRKPDFTDKDKVVYRGRPSRSIPESLQTITRQYIRSANQNGTHVTVEMLCKHLKNETTDQNFHVRTMSRTLNLWGFTFGKGTRSQHLKEKDYVVAARQRYLRRKLANRSRGNTIRPEVYLDESYVNKNHSNDFIWYSEEDGPWVQKPTGKGERLIIINAMTKHGWVPNAKLIFKSTRKTGDYHGQMNHEMFTKWLKEQLLPNIPRNSLIIMDNAFYHNTLSSQSAPTALCKKDRIRSWLESNKIPVRDDCLKAELIEMLYKLAPTPTYAIDEIAEAQGHEVLRTPPYHPELQPIETCWAIVKNLIAGNCDFTMTNLIIQLDKAFNNVIAKTCSGLIEKVRQIENKYWREDLKQDESE